MPLSQFDCLCGGTLVLGATMDGLVRHVCMPKHRKYWLANVEVEAPSTTYEELRASLARNWVPDQVDADHVTYVAKRKQTKQAEQNRADKVMRKDTVNAIARAFMPRTATAQGQSPAPPMADLAAVAGSPAALAAIQAALGCPGAGTGQ